MLWSKNILVIFIAGLVSISSLQAETVKAQAETRKLEAEASKAEIETNKVYMARQKELFD